MRPATQRALEGWLEYIQPRTWRWWIEGGYFTRKDGTLK